MTGERRSSITELPPRSSASGSEVLLSLVRLTKPLDVAPADQRAPEVEERLGDVGPPLVEHLEAPVAVQPRQRALEHPPVAPQPLARFGTNRTLTRAIRSGTRGLPPLGFGDSSGKSGSIASHSSAVTSASAMAASVPMGGFC